MSLLDALFGIQTIYKDGANPLSRNAVNFTGDVTVTDDATNGWIEIDIGTGVATAPADPGDDGKVAYASGGQIVYANEVKTDGTYLAIGATTSTTGDIRGTTTLDIAALETGLADANILWWDSDQLLLGDATHSNVSTLASNTEVRSRIGANTCFKVRSGWVEVSPAGASVASIGHLCGPENFAIYGLNSTPANAAMLVLSVDDLYLGSTTAVDDVLIDSTNRLIVRNGGTEIIRVDNAASVPRIAMTETSVQYDAVQIAGGDMIFGGVTTLGTTVRGLGHIYFETQGSGRELAVEPSAVTVETGILRFGATETTPWFQQTERSQPTANMENLRVQAQTNTNGAATGVGGNLELAPGYSFGGVGTVDVFTVTGSAIGNVTREARFASGYTELSPGGASVASSGHVRGPEDFSIWALSSDPTNVRILAIVNDDIYMGDTAAVDSFHLDCTTDVQLGDGTDTTTLSYTALTFDTDSAVTIGRSAHSTGSGSSTTIAGQAADSGSGGNGGLVTVRGGVEDGAGTGGVAQLASPSGVSRFKVGGTGIAFFAGSEAAKQTVTGARDAPEEALANLLTALENYGLITDSTTAT